MTDSTNPVTLARRAFVQAVRDTGIAGGVDEVIATTINTDTRIAFSPPANWIEPGDTFGGDLVYRLDAWLIVRPKNDVHDLEQLDRLLAGLYEAARQSGWGVSDVDQPTPLRYGDWSMFGTRVTVTHHP